MTPEVKALVEAARQAYQVIRVGGSEWTAAILLGAIYAVEALDDPATAHDAALKRGAEWDNDFGQQEPSGQVLR